MGGRWQRKGRLTRLLSTRDRGIAILRIGESSIGMLYRLLTAAEIHEIAGRVGQGLELLVEALAMAQMNNAR